MSFLTAHPRATYNPAASIRHATGFHAVLDQPLTVGRFKREAGDALCKPAWRFRALEIWHSGANLASWVRCERCRELAERHGVKIRDIEGA